MTPHAEKLVETAVQSGRQVAKLRAKLETTTEIYRADLAAALATQERGIVAAVARGLGTTHEKVRVDADAHLRERRRDAKRSPKPVLLDISRNPDAHPRDETGMYLKPARKLRKTT